MGGCWPSAWPGAAGAVVFDAGPFWDPDADWVSDEAGSHHLYWTEPRVIAGDDPVAARGQHLRPGGGRLDGPLRRLRPPLPSVGLPDRHDDGVGADWPIDYATSPYYEQMEEELPVAGERWPWGDPHRYPHSPHPIGGNGLVFERGAMAAGIEVRVGPVAITNGRFGNRPHCIYRGFCLQGCKVNAKASPLITHVPDALAHGAEIRPDAMVSRVEIDGGGGRPASPTSTLDASTASGLASLRSPATRSRPRACC